MNPSSSDPHLSGPWAEADIDRFLSEARYPVRLACTCKDGYPRVVSLWYRFHAGKLFCVMHQNATVARILSGNPKVGFEVSPNTPPYFGLRGQGDVTLEPLGDSNTLELLLGQYLGDCNSTLARWLLSRSDEELLVTIQPSRLFSWDYRERMADAV